MSVKTTPAQHQSNLRNVYGTFAIEGMIISKDTRSHYRPCPKVQPQGAVFCLCQCNEIRGTGR